MIQSEAVRYWFKSAEQNIKVAEDNFKLKHYDWSLFFWQLAIEKIPKGIIAKKGLVAPPIHNLYKLARIAQISIDEKNKVVLNEITSFSIEVRYDDYKFSFHKKATLNYVEKWIKNCREVYQWLQKFL